VGGTLGVTGATTLSGTAAITGPLTVSNGITNNGGMTQVGAVTVNGLATLDGGFTAHSGDIASAAVSSTHKRISAKFPASTGTALRSTRQPVVHNGNGTMSVTVGSSEVTVFDFVFTPKEDCNLGARVRLSAYNAVGGAQPAGHTGQITVRFRVQTDPGGVDQADMGFIRNVAAVVATGDKRPRIDPEWTVYPDCALTAGTQYRVRVSAKEDPGIGASLMVDAWSCAVMEVVRAV